MTRIISCRLGVPMILGGVSGNAASISALSVLVNAGAILISCIDADVLASIRAWKKKSVVLLVFSQRFVSSTETY